MSDLRNDKISNLTDLQAITISKIVCDRLIQRCQIESFETDVANIIVAMYEYVGQTPTLESIKRENEIADNTIKGKISKEFLIYVSDNLPDEKIIKVLEDNLQNPPDEGVAFIDVSSILYAVLGFVLAINVINGIRIETKHFTFDPVRGNENMKTAIKGVVDILRSQLFKK